MTLTAHLHPSTYRLPDPQRTHVMWGITKVSAGSYCAVPLLLVGFGLVCSGSSCWKDQVSSNRIPVVQCNKVVSLCLLQDFAVSGIRFGTLYTENQDVANAVASLCYFHGVCGPVQHKVAQLLRDRGESVPCTILCHSVCLGTWKISLPLCSLVVSSLYTLIDSLPLLWSCPCNTRLTALQERTVSAELLISRVRGAAWKKYCSYLYRNCQCYLEPDEQKQRIQACGTREMEMAELCPGWNANSPQWLRTINIGKLPEEGQGDTLLHRHETAKYFLVVFFYLRKQKTKEGGEVWSRKRHWVFWKLEQIWIVPQFMILFFIFFFWSDWINQVYLKANHARLKAAHTYVTDELKTLGVPFLNRNAGFFVWIDFRKVGGLRRWSFSQAEARPVVKLHLEERLILWQSFCFNKSVIWWGEGRTARCFSLFFSSICELPSLQESYYSQATSLPISSFVSQLLYFRGKRCLPWPLQTSWESQIHEDLSDVVCMVLTSGPSDDSPSTLRRAHLRRSCCSGSVFWIIRSSCPVGKPLSAVNLDGSASSLLTRPIGCS